jgi:two-component system, sensor histidine kinase and response regulator
VRAKRLYDVILMDCQMPDLDGFATATAWREREKNTGTSALIIALTGNDQNSTQARALAAGMNAVLSKPFRLEELLPLLHPVIKQKLIAVHADQKTQAALPVFDPTPFSQLFPAAQDARLKKELVAVFASDSVQQIVQLQQCLTHNDLVALARAAHKFKGACLSMGFMRCVHLCEHIERAAEHSDIPTCWQIMDALRIQHHDALEQLQRVIAENTP